MASPYEVLGVAPDADAAELRRAYLALARRHHPDVDGGDPLAMQAVNDAWATLGDPERRRRYDRTHPAPAAEPGGGADLDGPWGALADDDGPEGGGVPASGWFAVVPVGLFAASVGLGLLGVLLALPALVGVAVLTFALSCLAFVAAPLLSLYTARRRDLTGRAGPSG